jgi:4-alpha-glucanotransferase
VVLPLASIRSSRNFGIGQFSDLGAMARALGAAGFGWLSLLPINEIQPGLTSPYSSISSHAFDPIYLDLDEIEEVVALGGERGLERNDRRALEAARRSSRVDFATVRRLKENLLQRAFIRFELGAGRPGTSGAQALDTFVEEMSPWLLDDALFHVLRDANPSLSWRRWPIELRERRPEALELARRQSARLCRYYEWLQWHAIRQLEHAIDEVRRAGMRLAGDLPFALSEESAEAWEHQGELNFEANLGTPPDMFFPLGQNWGLPAYDWEALARTGYRWFEARLAWAARFYDLVRLDHAAGYFRTWLRPKSGAAPHYVPLGEDAQIAQGIEIIDRLRKIDVALMAEDLGDVPIFVRQALWALGVPGMRVLRWEVDDLSRQAPEDWPDLSIAMTGTHDTPPLTLWWESLNAAERGKFCALQELEKACARSGFDESVWLGLLETVMGSGSRLTLLPIEDLFGLRTQINRPGTISDDNWSFRLPWDADALWQEAAPRRALEAVSEMLRTSGRIRRESSECSVALETELRPAASERVDSGKDEAAAEIMLGDQE